MSKRRDGVLIGRLVKREVESRMSWPKFAERSNVSRATLYRVQDGDPTVTAKTLRKVERGLCTTERDPGAHGELDVAGHGAVPAQR